MAKPHAQHFTHRRFNFRGLITYLVTLSFLVMLTSGIVNFLAPSGRIARQVTWTLMGLDRSGWQALHLTFAVVFVAVGFIHLAYNWKGLLHYLRDRVSHHLTLKWEAIVALLVAFWLIGSAALALPPASTLHDFNSYFRQTYWTVAPIPQGKSTDPSVSETTIPLPATPAAPLPPAHPPVPPDKSCSDCHRAQ